MQINLKKHEVGKAEAKAWWDEEANRLFVKNLDGKTFSISTEEVTEINSFKNPLEGDYILRKGDRIVITF